MEYRVRFVSIIRCYTILKKNKGCETEVYEPAMPFNLEKNNLRAWTTNPDGKRHLINGLNIVYNMKILVIKK